ncbi:beta-1,3-galactosyltransferase 9-like [Mustelus asterias]
MVRLSWKRISQLTGQFSCFLLPSRCPRVAFHSSGKYRVCRFLAALLLVAACVLTVTTFSAGYIEEWLLSPVTGLPADPSVSRLREAAAAFDPAALKPDAASFYRLSAPDVCSGSGPFLVSFVVSKPAHRGNREAIRQSWGSVREVGGRKVRTLFALGVPESPEEQEMIDREAARYGDVVQGHFLDTYLNLTHKTIMVTRWFTTYCPSAQYLLKVDDDVFLNLQNLVSLLLGWGERSTDLYLGRVHRKVRAIRNATSLYYVSEAAYPADILPDYCSGTSYVLSGDMARKVYIAALTLPLLRIEDVFVGLCALRVGVHPTHTSRMSGGLRFPFSRCCYKSIITSHHIAAKELMPMWRLVNDGHSCSPLAKLAARFVCNLKNLLDQIRAA